MKSRDEKSRKGPRGRPRLFLVLLTLLFAVPGGEARAEPVVEASLSSQEVGTGEPFQLTVSVTSETQDRNLPWPQAEGLEAFEVRKESATSTRNQTTVLNGRVTQSRFYTTHFTYTLTAHRPGTFTIGPIRFEYGDFRKELGSAQITVSRQEPGLRLLPSLSKKNPFVGEQILYTLRIVPKAGVSNIEPPDFQKLLGEKFWFQRLDKNGDAREAVVDGQTVRVYDVRVALFPLLAGRTALPGIPMSYQQMTRSSRGRPTSVFDLLDEGFFGGNVANLKSQSAGLDLEALPLPPGAPAGFSGSVGRYAVTAAVDRQALPAGEALTLEVKIRGNGQPKSIDKPLLPALTAFEVFDPEEKVSTEQKGGFLQTEKTFKYVMIPGTEGRQTLGPIGYVYFDPDRKAYVRAESPPLTVEVGPSKNPVPAAAPAPRMADPKQTDRQEDGRPSEKGRFSVFRDLYQHPLFLPALFAGALGFPLLFALVWAIRRRRAQWERNADQRRRSQAFSRFKKGLPALQAEAQSNRPAEFHKKVSLALLGFAGDKLGRDLGGLTRDEVRRLLLTAGAAPVTLQDLVGLLEDLDFALYGGAGASLEAERILARLQKLVDRLERELP